VGWQSDRRRRVRGRVAVEAVNKKGGEGEEVVEGEWVGRQCVLIAGLPVQFCEGGLRRMGCVACACLGRVVERDLH